MSPDDILTTIDRRERLVKALNKMNTKGQKLAVILYLIGYEQKEIAEVYHCSRQNIQQIIAEFKRRNGVKELA